MLDRLFNHSDEYLETIRNKYYQESMNARNESRHRHFYAPTIASTDYRDAALAGLNDAQIAWDRQHGRYISPDIVWL